MQAVPLAIGATIVGAGMQAYGQYQAGKAADIEGKNAQKIANYNALVAEENARAAQAAATAEIQAKRAEDDRLKARQRVAFAASGVQMAGTPSILLEAQAADMELENLMIRHRGTVQANSFMSEAAGWRMQGQAARNAGKNSRIVSLYQAGSSLLTGASSAATMKYKYG